MRCHLGVAPQERTAEEHTTRGPRTTLATLGRGILGGMVSRAWSLSTVPCEGGTYPNTWNKFVPKPIYLPPHPKTWNELTWPKEFPMSMYEMSILLPHFLREGRGKLDVYFTRVYNAVWTNPDGFSWIDQMTKEDSPIGLHVALTPFLAAPHRPPCARCCGCRCARLRRSHQGGVGCGAHGLAALPAWQGQNRPCGPIPSFR